MVLGDQVDVAVELVDLVEAHHIGVVEGHRNLEFAHEGLDVLDVVLGNLLDGAPGPLRSLDAALVDGSECAPA